MTKRRCLRPRRWSLALCCNCPDNGMFWGRVDAVKIGAGRGNFDFGTDYLDDFELNLDGPYVKFQWLKDSFRLGRYTFPCEGIKEGVGNWCWDACFVDSDVIRKLCPILKAKGYTPDSGSTLLFNWWDNLRTDNRLCSKS